MKRSRWKLLRRKWSSTMETSSEFQEIWLGAVPIQQARVIFWNNRLKLIRKSLIFSDIQPVVFKKTTAIEITGRKRSSKIGKYNVKLKLSKIPTLSKRENRLEIFKQWIIMWFKGKFNYIIKLAHANYLKNQVGLQRDIEICDLNLLDAH